MVLQVIGKEHWYHYEHVKASPFDVVIRPAATAPSTSVASGESLTKAMVSASLLFCCLHYFCGLELTLVTTQN